MKHKTYAIPLLLVTLVLLALAHQSGLIRLLPEHRAPNATLTEDEAAGGDADAARQGDLQ